MSDDSPMNQQVDGGGSAAGPFQHFVDGGDAGAEMFLIEIDQSPIQSGQKPLPPHGTGRIAVIDNPPGRRIVPDEGGDAVFVRIAARKQGAVDHHAHGRKYANHVVPVKAVADEEGNRLQLIFPEQLVQGFRHQGIDDEEHHAPRCCGRSFRRLQGGSETDGQQKGSG